MTLQEIQYKAQGIIHKWRDDDSAPYIEFVEELAHMIVPEPSEDLEEAAKEFAKNAYLDKHNLVWMFKRGAKWQEEKEKEYSPWLVIPKLKEAALEFGEQAKDHEIGGQSFAEDMAIAFTRGAEWQKEQMMKEAVKWLKETGANNLYISMFQRDMEGKK